MSMRMNALHELVGFFDHLSGKRPDAKKDLKPSDKAPVDDENEEVMEQGDASLPLKPEEQAMNGGSADGVLNSDPQRRPGEGMPDEEKPKGNKVDMKALMKKHGRMDSGSKGTVFTAGHLGMSRKSK